MEKYFVDKSAMVEFSLLYLDGQSRMKMLGITRQMFSSKKLSKEWYEDMKKLDLSDKARQTLDMLYQMM
jgi:hypothetical protein